MCVRLRSSNDLGNASSARGANRVVRRLHHFPDVRRKPIAAFSEAAQENANSRLWAGVHFPRANRDGLRLGQKLGAYVFRPALPKLKH
jgi:hypothetical protein